jgi:IS30 family transposase
MSWFLTPGLIFPGHHAIAGTRAPPSRANEADSEAWDSAWRPKRRLLSIQVKLRKIVASKLILDWSPEQISGWLKSQYPDDESMRVSKPFTVACSFKPEEC